MVRRGALARRPGGQEEGKWPGGQERFASQEARKSVGWQVARW